MYRFQFLQVVVGFHKLEIGLYEVTAGLHEVAEVLHENQAPLNNHDKYTLNYMYVDYSSHGFSSPCFQTASRNL